MDDHNVEDERPSVFFWVVVVAAVFYLGVRLIQGVVWVVERLV